MRFEHCILILLLTFSTIATAQQKLPELKSMPSTTLLSEAPIDSVMKIKSEVVFTRIEEGNFEKYKDYIFKQDQSNVYYYIYLSKEMNSENPDPNCLSILSVYNDPLRSVRQHTFKLTPKVTGINWEYASAEGRYDYRQLKGESLTSPFLINLGEYTEAGISFVCKNGSTIQNIVSALDDQVIFQVYP